MSKTIKTYEDLEPRHIWSHFASMSQVPRCSKKEERIIAWARRTAK